MKLILHIIWKDIRCERWALAFWALLYVVQTGLGLLVFHQDAGDRDFLDAVTIGNIILVTAQFVTCYLLVVRFVQSDPIAGTRMFWLTRPISPGRLLRAKAWGAVLVFGLLPVLLKTPWWLYCGFTAGDVARAAFETVGWQVLLIAPAFLIASLTDDFGRALTWGLLLVVFLVCGGIVVYSINQRESGVDRLLQNSGGLLFTRLWLTAALLVAGSAVIAAHQFQTRRLVRSIILAGSMVTAALLAGRFWPWDCAVLFKEINNPDPIRDVAADSYPGLQLTIKPAQIVGNSEISGRPAVRRTWVQHTMEVRGTPAGWALGVVKMWPSWNWPEDPVRVEGDMTWFSDWSQGQLRTMLGMPPSPGDDETLRWMEMKAAEQRARGQQYMEPVFAYWKSDPLQADHLTLSGRTLVPNAVIARIRSQPPAGDASVELQLATPRKLFELPLTPDTHWAGASVAYRVGPWGNREENVGTLQLMKARPSVRENGLWLVETMYRTYFQNPPREMALVLVNRSDNSFGSARKSGNTANSGRVVIGGVVLQWGNFSLSSRKVIRNGQWVAADPKWNEHSTLVLIDPGQMVRLTRELKVPKYELLPGESGSGNADGKKADKS